MLGESREYMLYKPILSFFIAALIALTMFAFNMIDEGLRREWSLQSRSRASLQSVGPFTLTVRRLVFVVGCGLVIVLAGWKLIYVHLGAAKEHEGAEAEPVATEAQPTLAVTGKGAALVDETEERYCHPRVFSTGA